LDAPLYPPSQAWEPPIIVPQPMNTRTSSIADFLSNPKALAILKAQAPGLDLLIGSPLLKPHLGNMSPRDMVVFGAFKPDALDKVDAALKAQGVMQGGRQ
jgi:hypothetical protein